MDRLKLTIMADELVLQFKRGELTGNQFVTLMKYIDNLIREAEKEETYYVLTTNID